MPMCYKWSLSPTKLNVHHYCLPYMPHTPPTSFFFRHNMTMITNSKTIEQKYKITLSCLVFYCVLCTVYFVLCTMYCVLCTVYFVLCIVYFVLCTVYFVLCIVYFVLCTLYYALCTLYYVLCTLYCALCTLYCALCTLYCVLYITNFFTSTRVRFTYPENEGSVILWITGTSLYYRVWTPKVAWSLNSEVT